MTEEPRTEAGQRLYDDLAFAAPELWRMHIERRLAEARDAALDAVTTWVAELPHWPRRGSVRRSEVLAAIEEVRRG